MSNSLAVFTIYTDGSCPRNADGGPGGYAAIFLEGLEDPNQPWGLDPDKVVKVAHGGEPATTNNRMELMGIIAALETALEFGSCRLEIVSDSQYCVNGSTSWCHSWAKTGWKNSQGKPVKNQDLWERVLDLLPKHHHVTFRWVRGHKGAAFNELADRVAGRAAQQYIASQGVGSD